MGGCSPDFVMPRAAADAETKPVCSESEQQQYNGALPLKKNGTVQSANGVYAHVVDLFEPADKKDDEGNIVCLDFYVGQTQLNDKIECFQFTKPYKNECRGNTFTDYGVKIEFWNPDVNRGIVPLAIHSDVTTPLNNPEDLYKSCLAAGHLLVGCLRYVNRYPLSEEQVLSNAATITFVPKDEHTVLGQYIDRQNIACTETDRVILNPHYPLPEPGVLRYQLVDYLEGNDHKKMFGKSIGTAYPNFSSIYYSTKNIVDHIEKAIPEIYEIPGQCHDPVICHERAHNFWLSRSGQSSYFPFALQEGAARWLEINVPLPPEPKIHLEQSLQTGQSFQYHFTDPIIDEPVLITTEVINMGEHEALIKVTQKFESTNDPGNSTTINLKDKTIVNIEPFPHPLMIDINGDGTTGIRFREIYADPSSLSQMKLDCHPDNYDISIGLWSEGNFYRNTLTNLLDEGMNTPYNPLDSSKSALQIYNTGACFFEGIHVLYNQNGKEFLNFFYQLTQAIQVHSHLSLKEQYDTSFCILDVMQSAIDFDLGKNVFDIYKLASQFKVNPDDNCNRLPLQSHTNRFGAEFFF